jgi:ribonuclease J
MHKVVGAAQSVGLLRDAPQFVDEAEAGCLPRENVLYLCTGSQGEPRAALTRIARGEHRHVSLNEGDAVIFSSRVIPGNEAAIFALYNELTERGVNVITSEDENVHVSGHPCRGELRQMYQWARPKIAIPVHGERRHLVEHVKLARELQIAEALAPRNGDLIRLAPGRAELIDEVPAGRLYADGSSLVEAEDEALQERRRIGAEGMVSIGLVVHATRHAILSGPDVRVRGLSMQDEEELDIAIEELEHAAEAAFNRLNHADRADDDLAEGTISRAVRKAAERVWGKRPFVEVMLMRT